MNTNIEENRSLDSLPRLDLRSQEFLDSPETVLMDLMSQSKLAISERGVEVLDYRLIADLYNDRRMRPLPWQHYRDVGSPPQVVNFTRQHPLHMEPDRHLRVRRMLTRAFQPARVEQLRPIMTGIANDLVDGLVERGEFDFTKDFTHYYTIRILCSLIGVPEKDVDVFGEATLEMMLLLVIPFPGRDERLIAAVETLGAYVSSLIESRTGQSGDDFITTMVNAPEEERLTDEEIVLGVANLLFAGHDTTRYQLGSCIRALIEEDLWGSVRNDPEQIPAIVEEAMRVYSTVSHTSRLLETAIELDGVHLPEGTVLALNAHAAGVDPTRFDDPLTFDASRDTADGRRVPFGHGLHKCIGHALARQGMEVGLEVLTQRIAAVELANPIQFVDANMGAQGPTSLPVRILAGVRDA